MNTVDQYVHYIQPTWAPPAWVFGPVWSVLYILIALSFGYIFYKYYKKEVSLAFVIPFLLNLIFNFAFTYIQFGLRNLILATVDILFVLLTIVWLMIVSWKKYRWVALANIPYLVWVLFATVLQLTLTSLNR